MIWIIGYIIGMIITLFLWLWRLSGMYNRLCRDDYFFLFLAGLIFPLSLPMLIVFNMAELFQNSLKFIFWKMQEWREKK